MTTEYQLQICKVICTAACPQVVKIRGIHHEGSGYSFHISSLKDREMKNKELNQNPADWIHKNVA
jgi:hypothetical protein